MSSGNDFLLSVFITSAAIGACWLCEPLDVSSMDTLGTDVQEKPCPRGTTVAGP